METSLLRSYLATVYELPTVNGPIRASLDGDIVTDPSTLPELLTRPFTVLTAYNPRSMLLPRKVNEARHIVLRDSVFNHLAHHRGQLTVYLRLNDAPVPAIYGPTGDEAAW